MKRTRFRRLIPIRCSGSRNALRSSALPIDSVRKPCAIVPWHGDSAFARPRTVDVNPLAILGRLGELRNPVPRDLELVAGPRSPGRATAEAKR